MLQIERIENQMLYQSYKVKLKDMKVQNKPGTKNERKLWHGTDARNIKSINTYGFNRSFCGINGKNSMEHL